MSFSVIFGLTLFMEKSISRLFYKLLQFRFLQWNFLDLWILS